jgi:hypothetical protein
MMLLTELDKSKSQPETCKAKEIRRLEAKLKEHPNMTVIPTDKTNSYKVIDKEKYIEWVLDHLKTDAIEVSADKLIKIHEEGNELLSKLGNTLSEKEMGFVEEMLDSRAVPTPKLLIKDHKPMNKKGEYVTRLIFPGNELHSGIPKSRIPQYQKHLRPEQNRLLGIYYHPSISTEDSTRETEYHEGQNYNHLL